MATQSRRRVQPVIINASGSHSSSAFRRAAAEAIQIDARTGDASAALNEHSTDADKYAYLCQLFNNASLDDQQRQHQQEYGDRAGGGIDIALNINSFELDRGHALSRRLNDLEHGYTALNPEGIHGSECIVNPFGVYVLRIDGDELPTSWDSFNRSNVAEASAEQLLQWVLYAIELLNLAYSSEVKMKTAPADGPATPFRVYLEAELGGEARGNECFMRHTPPNGFMSSTRARFAKITGYRLWIFQLTAKYNLGQTLGTLLDCNEELINKLLTANDPSKVLMFLRAAESEGKQSRGPQTLSALVSTSATSSAGGRGGGGGGSRRSTAKTMSALSGANAADCVATVAAEMALNTPSTGRWRLLRETAKYARALDLVFHTDQFVEPAALEYLSSPKAGPLTSLSNPASPSIVFSPEAMMKRLADRANANEIELLQCRLRAYLTIEAGTNKKTYHFALPDCVLRLTPERQRLDEFVLRYRPDLQSVLFADTRARAAEERARRERRRALLRNVVGVDADDSSLASAAANCAPTHVPPSQRSACEEQVQQSMANSDSADYRTLEARAELRSGLGNHSMTSLHGIRMRMLGATRRAELRVCAELSAVEAALAHAPSTLRDLAKRLALERLSETSKKIKRIALCMYKESCMRSISPDLSLQAKRILEWGEQRMRAKPSMTVPFVVMDNDLSTFANLMAMLSYSLDRVMFTVGYHDIALTMLLVAPDAYRYGKGNNGGMHFNILLQGGPATSKSFLLNLVHDTYIPKTVGKVTDETVKSNTGSGDANDVIGMYEEMQQSLLTSDPKMGGNPTQEGIFKDMLTSSEVRTKSLVVDDNGDRKMIEMVSETNRVVLGATNHPHAQSDPIKSRFYRPEMGSRYTGGQMRTRPVSNLVGIERHLSPEAQAARETLSETVRINQYLSYHIEKLIMIGALRDVSHTCFDAIFQSFSSHMAKRFITTIDTRDVERMHLLLRRLVIWTALYYLYNLEGVSPYYGKPFEIDQLLDIEPYLHDTEEMALFVLELMRDCYLRPNLSKIMRGIADEYVRTRPAADVVASKQVLRRCFPNDRFGNGDALNGSPYTGTPDDYDSAEYLKINASVDKIAKTLAGRTYGPCSAMSAESIGKELRALDKKFKVCAPIYHYAQEPPSEGRMYDATDNRYAIVPKPNSVERYVSAFKIINEGSAGNGGDKRPHPSGANNTFGRGGGGGGGVATPEQQAALKAAAEKKMAAEAEAKRAREQHEQAHAQQEDAYAFGAQQLWQQQQQHDRVALLKEMDRTALALADASAAHAALEIEIAASLAEAAAAAADNGNGNHGPDTYVLVHMSLINEDVDNAVAKAVDVCRNKYQRTYRRLMGEIYSEKYSCLFRTQWYKPNKDNTLMVRHYGALSTMTQYLFVDRTAKTPAPAAALLQQAERTLIDFERSSLATAGVEEDNADDSRLGRTDAYLAAMKRSHERSGASHICIMNVDLDVDAAASRLEELHWRFGKDEVERYTFHEIDAHARRMRIIRATGMASPTRAQLGAARAQFPVNYPHVIVTVDEEDDRAAARHNADQLNNNNNGDGDDNNNNNESMQYLRTQSFRHGHINASKPELPEAFLTTQEDRLRASVNFNQTPYHTEREREDILRAAIDDAAVERHVYRRSAAAVAAARPPPPPPREVSDQDVQNLQDVMAMDDSADDDNEASDATEVDVAKRRSRRDDNDDMEDSPITNARNFILENAN